MSDGRIRVTWNFHVLESAEQRTRFAPINESCQRMREISVKSGRPGCLEARVQVTGRDDAAFRLACASPFPNPDQDPQTNHNFSYKERNPHVGQCIQESLSHCAVESSFRYLSLPWPSFCDCSCIGTPRSIVNTMCTRSKAPAANQIDYLLAGLSLSNNCLQADRRM